MISDVQPDAYDISIKRRPRKPNQRSKVVYWSK